MQKQIYWNKCGCNESDALVRRHILDTLPEFKTSSPVKVALRQGVLEMARVLSGERLKQLSFSEVMENTRNNIKKRYQQAHFNIHNNRIYADEGISRISCFVKFEKIPETKMLEQKPARCIQFRSYEYTYLLKSFICAHSLLIKETDKKVNDQYIRTIFTKTYDNEGIASTIRDSWDSMKDPVAICLDHSKWDGHYDTELLELEHEYWLTIHRDRLLKRLLSLQLKNKGISQNGIRYKSKGKRMSGEYTTSEGNSLMNYNMIAAVLKTLGVLRFRVHVNGDDSITIVERQDVKVIVENLKLFRYLNMETEIEAVAEDFRQIKYCQTSPIRVMQDGVLKWLMIKDPIRAMSRSCYTDLKFKQAISRYTAGVGLCELACSSGVPMLQAWAMFMIKSANYARPLGCVDKMPARLMQKSHIRIQEIDEATRCDFEVAFGITAQEQHDWERIAGDLRDPSLKNHFIPYLQKYKNFHLH